LANAYHHLIFDSLSGLCELRNLVAEEIAFHRPFQYMAEKLELLQESWRQTRLMVFIDWNYT